MRVFVVDDDVDYLDLIQVYLKDSDFQVVTEQNVQQALKKLAQESFDILITDLLMDPIDGIELTEKALAFQPKLEVFILSAVESVQKAVDAIKAGARNYLLKPISQEEIILQLNRTKQEIIRRKYLESLQLQDKEKASFLTADKKLNKVVSEVSKAAKSDSSILIVGEHGTGKTQLAKYIHYCSDRKEKPFVIVPCASLSDDNCAEMLLGNFDASRNQQGYFSLVQDGTLFLEGVTELSLNLQGKLLAILQSKKQNHFKARILASSSVPIKAEIKKGNFREDLYYELNVFEFFIPPLRKRRNDIMLYFEKFLQEECEKQNRKKPYEIHPAVVKSLQAYHWPGNVREVRNVVERIAILARDVSTITLEYLPQSIRYSRFQEGSNQAHHYESVKRKLIRDFEIGFISEHLRLNKGNVEKTAYMIGMHPVSLRQKISKIGIDLRAIKKEYK